MTRLEEMKALATEEAVKLKQYATKEELDNLDLKDLDPLDEDSCIYGQMTGGCNSERAQELIMLCANRVYDVKHVDHNFDLNANVNGSPYKVRKISSRSQQYQSPIEMLIYSSNGGEGAQAKLIAFLKDETQTLEL